MLVMPPPKKPAAGKQPEPASEPPKKQPNRNGKAINVWVTLDVHAALKAFMKGQRIEPKLTDVVEVALQEFLKREGFWPLKGEPSSPATDE